MIFLNSAIFLTTEGSPHLDVLRELEAGGTRLVSCITCLIYMDTVQTEMSNGNGEYAIPVFDYNQLLALCQGFDPQQVARISEVPRDGVWEQMDSLATTA